MQRKGAVTATLFAVLAFGLAPAIAAPENPEIVVRATDRAKIERILEADNLDTSELPAGEVAAIMARIERQGAPTDFWRAYRLHVAAWVRYADALRRRSEPESSVTSDELFAAGQAIETSFDTVERIARSYGARVPRPAWKNRF